MSGTAHILINQLMNFVNSLSPESFSLLFRNFYELFLKIFENVELKEHFHRLLFSPESQQSSCSDTFNAKCKTRMSFSISFVSSRRIISDFFNRYSVCIILRTLPHIIRVCLNDDARKIGAKLNFKRRVRARRENSVVRLN